MNTYLCRRRVKAFLTGLLFRMCRVFPVEPDKIVMWTFEGQGGYGDSPKYVAEEILRRNEKRERKYKIVWLTDLSGKDFPQEIKIVKNSIANRAYHLSTAGFWVGNTRTGYGTKKRKETVYLQTWHSIAGIKPIGAQRGGRMPQIARLVSEADSALIDHVLAGNEWSCRMLPSGLLYDGPILRTGIPRCDVLFSGKEEMRRKYREQYRIPLDTSILLYAPTFRGGSQKGKRSVTAVASTMDFGRLIHALEAKFGGNWYVFLRFHPQVAGQAEAFLQRERNGRVVNASGYPDMNELLVASDILITDYSSSVFESMLMKQPAFLFVEDEQEYVEDRGELMFRLEDLPVPVAYDMAGLERRIADFDRSWYEEDVERFMNTLGVFEDGKASGRVVDLMEERLLCMRKEEQVYEG